MCFLSAYLARLGGSSGCESVSVSGGTPGPSAASSRSAIPEQSCVRLSTLLSISSILRHGQDSMVMAG